MRLPFLAACLALSAHTGYAQVPASTYTFSALSGTFTDIAGSPGLVTLPASFLGDNVTSNTIPIGFTFYYCGSPYTQVAACTNGWLSFNAASTSTASGNSLANLSTSAAANVKPALMPLWDDLRGSADSAASATYVTTGAAPNRVFIFQWKNWQWNRSSAVNISFQVKLYEAGNVIEYCYQQGAAAGNPTGSSGATIGIADGAATPVYLTLSNATAAPVASSAIFTTNITTRPATGQVYRFIPLPRFDMAADSVIVAPSFCARTSQPVSVRMKNLGTEAITSVELHWSVDGIAQPMVAYSGAAVSNVLSAPANRKTVLLGDVLFPDNSPRRIKVWTARPNSASDEVPVNDSVARMVAADLTGVEVHIRPGDTAICSGDHITLDAGAHPGAPIYIWSTGSLDQSIPVSGSGRYIVKVQNNSGCFDRDTVTVTVLPDPIAAGIGAVDNGDLSYTFNAISAQHVKQYKWDFGDGSAPVTGAGLPAQAIHAYAAGTYTVKLILTNDCHEIIIEQKISVGAVGIDGPETWQKEILLYPNPARGLVTLQAPDGLKILKVALYNIIGQQVYTNSGSAIDVTGMPAGSYQVVIFTGKGKVVRKLLVKK